MAVGAVSSSQTQSAPKGTVLRVGTQLATTPEALKSGKGKTYYHMAAGARFIMPDGLELVFMGGQLTTDDPAIIAELDAVANRATSMIYTQQENLQAVAQSQAKKVADEAADTAGKQAE
jgi:hypothetical protein